MGNTQGCADGCFAFLQGKKKDPWADKDYVLGRVQGNGSCLEDASDILKADKEVVLAAVKNFGLALEFAAEDLKADTEVVLAAIKQNGSALKFAKGDLTQDPALLKAAGLWDAPDDNVVRSEKGILSLKFSLSQESTTYASDFVQALKRDPFLRQFEMHNPNARCKKSCDPDYTTPEHPCKGTLKTCQLAESKLVKKDTAGNKKLGEDACWRFAFRFRQEECLETNGFMLQVEEETGVLGPGQKLEAVWAKEVGIKVFRTYTDEISWNWNRIEKISQKVQEWYESGCANMDLENVYIGEDDSHSKPRPPYGEDYA